MGNHHFGRFTMVATQLVDANCYRFCLGSILALDYKDGQAVDQEDDIFPIPVVSVVVVILFCDVVDVLAGVGVVDQDQVAFAVFGRDEIGLFVAQVA